MGTPNNRVDMSRRIFVYGEVWKINDRLLTHPIILADVSPAIRTTTSTANFLSVKWSASGAQRLPRSAPRDLSGLSGRPAGRYGVSRSEVAAASGGCACSLGALQLNAGQLLPVLAEKIRGVLVGEARRSLQRGGYAQVQGGQPFGAR